MNTTSVWRHASVATARLMPFHASALSARQFEDQAAEQQSKYSYLGLRCGVRRKKSVVLNLPEIGQGAGAKEKFLFGFDFLAVAILQF